MNDAIDLIRRLHEHRAWANENLLDAAGGLSDAQLQQHFPIGQGSIWKSLVHMYAAEWVWLAALEGDDDPLLPGDVRGKIPGNQLGEGGIASLAELRTLWRTLDDRWQKYLAAISPAALDDMVYKVTAVPPVGQRLATRRYDILLHVALHAHYTAAQVVNMLRHAGVEKLPTTMLISLARQESQPTLK